MPPHATRRRFLHRASTAAAGAAVALAVPSVRAAPLPLVVWFTPQGAKAMRQLGAQFTQATGVPVVVETPDEGPQKFQQAASAGKGPDVFIYAHDRIGEWIAGGLIHAVQPTRAFLDDTDPLALQGFSLKGRLWGYPMAIEAITLVYNKALVATPPRSFDEVWALDKRLAAQGRRAILWDYQNPYYSWPVLAAQGGYAFGQRPDGSHDPQDVGLNHPGAIQGLELIDRLIREGAMPRGSSYANMEAAVAGGKVAMMINGPWSWVNLKRAGIDFGVARIPSLGGRPASPFVGVKGVLINRSTRQREAAVEFVEHHLLGLQGLRTIDRAEPIGAPASRRYFQELSVDPRIVGIMDSARDGVPTPSLPEMGRLWSALKTALTNVSEGRQSPRDALEAAARRTRQAAA